MRFIFVGGCARSGTSLVQKLLASHSRIVGGPEFDHTAGIFELYRSMSVEWRLARQSFYYEGSELARAFKDFYEGFFAPAVERKAGADFVSEKTPSNIFAAKTLLELWPDAVFVNVVRDGRDVLLSHEDVNRRYRQRGERNPERDTLLSVSRHWNACADAYFSLISRPELRDRVFLIEFEKLVAEPKTELSRLFDFLGLTIEERQLCPEEITEQETGVALEGAYFTKDLYRQPFNTGKTARWRREMNPIKRTASTALLRTNLRRFHYPV
ncbi:sulfotransferase family protein [Streptomyces sp. NPDC057743]|uniref:sulfotransferase family protein n=1 Tax=Streptomyces sp. NPDC057743 TaxID=3346236 RepID=UPI0036A05AE5